MFTNGRTDGQSDRSRLMRQNRAKKDRNILQQQAFSDENEITKALIDKTYFSKSLLRVRRVEWGWERATKNVRTELYWKENFIEGRRRPSMKKGNVELLKQKKKNTK